MKKFLALGSLVMALSLAVAAGAFTSVSADRTANVTVAGDASAYLGLTPTDGSPNSAYCYIDTGGELVIDMTDSHSTSAGGNGVNPNAETDFDDVFTVTNQGTQPIDVGLTDSGNNDGAVKFYIDGAGSTDVDGDGNSDDLLIETDEGGSTVTIDDGKSEDVSIYVDSSSLSQGADMLDSITVSAEAT